MFMRYSPPLITIKVTQTIGAFFLTKMTPSLLNQIANKSLSIYKDSQKGLQREINAKKVEEIRSYLKEDPSACFPNTIILAIRDDLDFEEPLIKFDDQERISIALAPDVANIIDGQHRLAGFDELDDNFELPVAVFINLPLGEQAKIFAKINSTQTKVNLDVVYENFFKSEHRSREKIAFYLVKNLNEKNDSPWFKKIKTLSDKGGDLAQGSMAKFFDKKLLSDGGVLGDWYKGERDQLIYDVIKSYFRVIANTFPVAWENEDGEYILKKTTGFVGTMMFFQDILRKEMLKDTIPDYELFARYFEGINEKEFPSLVNDNFKAGGVGQSDLRKALRERSRLYAVLDGK